MVEGGAPKATGGSFLLGVLCWEVGAEVVGEVCCSCSKAPWRCRFRAMVISCGGLMAGRGWYLCEADRLRFLAIFIMGRSWVGSSVWAAFQSGSYWKEN